MIKFVHTCAFVCLLTTGLACQTVAGQKLSAKASDKTTAPQVVSIGSNHELVREESSLSSLGRCAINSSPAMLLGLGLMTALPATTPFAAAYAAGSYGLCYKIRRDDRKKLIVLDGVKLRLDERANEDLRRAIRARLNRLDVAIESLEKNGDKVSKKMLSEIKQLARAERDLIEKVVNQGLRELELGLERLRDVEIIIKEQIIDERVLEEDAAGSGGAK